MPQIFARIGLGLAAQLMLLWALWPPSWQDVFREGEAIVAYTVAFFVWVFSEFRDHKNELFDLFFVNGGGKPGAELQLTDNDLRNARDLLWLHSDKFRVLLKEHDTFQFIDAEYIRLTFRLLDRHSRGLFVFQDEELKKRCDDFIRELEAFSAFMRSNSLHEHLAGRNMQGFKPIRTVSDELYNKQLAKSHQANDLAESAWKAFDKLCLFIRSDIKGVLDRPIESVNWFDQEN